MRNGVLLAHRRYRGPKIVAIGGGTGLSNFKGLKAYSAITAIVTVRMMAGLLDGCGGKLVLPGRYSCLAALADEESW